MFNQVPDAQQCVPRKRIFHNRNSQFYVRLELGYCRFHQHYNFIAQFGSIKAFFCHFCWCICNLLINDIRILFNHALRIHQRDLCHGFKSYRCNQSWYRNTCAHQ